MTDILFIKRRDRAHAFAESEKGKGWLKRKMDLRDDASVSTEYMEELISMMEEDDLIVEVK